jgi:hypothetical protein
MAEEERGVTTFESEPIQDVRRSAHYTTIWAVGLASIAFLGVLGYAVWLVRAWLLWLGYLVLGAVGLALLIGVAFPVVLLLRMIFERRRHTIAEHGIVLERMFSRPAVIAPQATASGAKLAPEKKQKAAPTFNMLSMLDMIDQGIIAPGQTRVILGYTQKGELEARKRPNVYVIAGKGRSGKSRRATLMIGQDLIALAPLMNLRERKMGARIIICDPHGIGKPDSLRRLLEPLGAWIEFASTEAEIAQLTREFIDEMEARLAGTSVLGLDDGRYVPWVLYYDEWSRLMSKYSEEATELMQNCVQSCAQEYAGVDGFVALLGQDWTSDACGGTAIRRAIQDAFIHNISAEYAKFFLAGLSGRKWAARAESLRVRDCIHKDYEGQVQQLLTPHVGDDVPRRLAEIMQQLCPAQPVEIPTFAESLVGPKMDAPAAYRDGYRERTTGPLPEQIAFRQLPAARFHRSPSPEQLYELENLEIGEPGESVNGLHRQGEPGESVPVHGEGFTMTDSEPAYTHEQETAILAAAFQIARETGKITRSDIMERLNWNRKQWPIIKAVCDRHNIAKQ